MRPTTCPAPHGRRSYGDDEILLNFSAPPHGRGLVSSPVTAPTKRVSFTSQEIQSVACSVEAKNPRSIPAGDDYGYRP